MASTTINLCFNEKINFNKFWTTCICQTLKNFTHPDLAYEVRMTDDVFDKRFEEINQYYTENSNIRYCCIEDENRFYFHYFESSLDVFLTLPVSVKNPIIRDFINNMEKLYSFSNIIITDTSYRFSFVKKPIFSPRKSLLYIAPNLRNTREFYIEGVSAEMWFGESFWQYASCSREEVITCDWLETEEKENGVLYVKAYHKPFDSREGEQLAIQRRLLKLLFNIDENRPHGYEPTGAKLKTFVQKAYTDGQTTIVGDLKEQSE